MAFTQGFKLKCAVAISAKQLAKQKKIGIN